MTLRRFPVVVAASLYSTWLYLSTLLFAILPMSTFGLIGKSLAALLGAVLLATELKTLVHVSKISFVFGALMACVAVGASSQLDPDGAAALQAGYLIGTQAGVFILFTAIGYREAYLKAFLFILGFVALVSAGIGIWGALTQKSFLTRAEVGVGVLGFDDTTGRSGGLQGENYVGLWLAPALAQGLHWAVNKKWRVLGLSVVVVSVAGIAASLSRTSAAGAAAGVLLWLLLRPGQKLMPVLIVTMLLSTVAINLIPGLLGKQLSGMDQLRTEQTNRWQEFGDLSGRLLIWGELAAQYAESPVWGKGADSSLRLLGVVAHNAFLDVAIDYGIVGLILFVASTVYTVANLVTKWRVIRSDEYLPRLYIMWLPGLICWLTLSSAWVNLIWLLNGMLFGRLLLLRDSISGGGSFRSRENPPFYQRIRTTQSITEG